jgi:hypothetical protein
MREFILQGSEVLEKFGCMLRIRRLGWGGGGGELLYGKSELKQ